MARPSQHRTWFADLALYPPNDQNADASASQHAHAVEYLLPFLRPGSRILDVGSGSGYLSAVLHYLVTDLDSGVSGTVIGIEHIPELVDWSKTNLQRDGLGAALESGHVKVVTGDGRQGKQDTAALGASYHR